MKIPSNELVCRTLFLQAADSGRGPVLFGNSKDRACEAILPFLEGVPFPEMYLEFPLSTTSKGAFFLSDMKSLSVAGLP